MHQTLLHANFLSNPTEYALSERYWRDLFRAIAREEGASDDWQDPWLNTKFVDGTSFADGNPIFSAWTPKRRLGVRIIQLDPANAREELNFSSWLDVFGDGDDAIRELVICGVLADENSLQASRMIRQWVAYGTAPATEAGTALTKR
jgi:hypothetical protein